MSCLNKRIGKRVSALLLVLTVAACSSTRDVVVVADKPVKQKREPSPFLLTEPPAADFQTRQENFFKPKP